MATKRISAKQGAALKQRVKLGGVLGAPLFMTGGFLWAQDADGGLSTTLDISQRFEHIEEEGFTGASDEGVRSLTTLSFGLSSETRTQSLAFGLSTGIAQNLTNGGSTEFEGTQASLDYRISNRNTQLTIGAQYRRDETDDLAFDTSLEDDDITTGEGQREVFTLTTGIEVGRDGPLRGTFTHVFEKSEFSDTLDPTLNDSHRQRVNARLEFDLATNLTASVFGSWSDLDEQGAGATDRKTSRIGIGAAYEITSATTLTGEIAYSEEESRGMTVAETDGLNYAFTLAHRRPNGQITIDFSEADTLNGKRRQATLGRSYDLRRGEFSFSLGATKTDGFGAQLLANLNLDYELDRNNRLSIGLSQTGDINDDNNEVLNTRLNMSYTRALSSLSEISANVAYIDENELGMGATDQNSIRFGLNHSYKLGQDWDLVSGYEYSSVRQDGVVDRDRSRLFVGVQKGFAWRP